MATDASRSRRVRVPAWKVRLNVIRHLREFPDRDEYPFSLWADWEKRVQEGHAAEEEKIERRYKDVPDDNPDDLGVDEHQQTCRLTTSMYAALIVAMWAQVEEFLNGIARACDDASGAGKKAKTKRKTIKIKQLCDGIQKATGIAVDRCCEAATVNAIWILNNAFKHDDGYYVPDKTDRHERIDRKLRKTWGIKEDERIDYSELPIEDLVLAGNTFCGDLLSRVNAKLSTQTATP